MQLFLQAFALYSQQLASLLSLQFFFFWFDIRFPCFSPFCAHFCQALPKKAPMPLARRNVRACAIVSAMQNCILAFGRFLIAF